VAQVLGNLIANALKFTPGGGITLDCTRRDDACIIAVSDTGVGIRPEDMNRLFRPFSQIENGLTGLREGTGLGLAISRHLAQAMGATIQVESEWGKGSRFSFTLPMGGKA
jgi:signal transduction histidine kinase